MWNLGVLLLFVIGLNALPLEKDVVPQELPSAQCDMCVFIAQTLHNLWGDQTTEDCLGDFITHICVQFKIEDNFICKGIVGSFKDEFVWVAGQLIVNPNQICGLLLKDCEHLFNPLNGTWTVPLPGNKPPMITPTPPTDHQQPKLRVLHLTDIHLDMDYVVGSEAKCSEPQCCRNNQDPHEISIDDNIIEPAGYWGTIGSCDAPYWLFTNMLQHAKETHKDLDYILVSGDLMSHADWDYTRTTHQAMVKNISDSIRSYFPGIPTYFAIGNHEGVPIDTFAPRFAPERFHMDFLYDQMADSWHDWVPKDQIETLKFNGNYVVKLFPGLRLISLNTPLGGDAVNFFLYVNQTDPDGTMTWFVNQLEAAEKAGDKVHIVAHIPGGDGEALEGWSLNYYNAINRFQYDKKKLNRLLLHFMFSNTVGEQFMGHTHNEAFYVMYEDPENAKSTPTSVIYSAPSITTYSEYNPAYRVYTLDGNYTGSTFGIIDFEDWYFDLSVNTDQSKSVWQPLFTSVLEEYGLKNCGAAEWNNLIERMKTDNSLFGKYMRNYYRHDPTKECDFFCQMNILCDSRKAHHSENLCKDLYGATGTNAQPMYRKEVKPQTPSFAEVVSSIQNIRESDKCKA